MPEGSGPTCANCFAPLTPDNRFCAACGTPVEAAPTESKTRAFSASQLSIPITLVVIDEAGTVLGRYPLLREETTLGRGEADVAFPDDQFLSPLHAQLSFREGRLYLRDLGSRNSTWSFIEEPYRLVDGDLLLIGSQIFRFRRLGYPGPHPPERDATRRMGSLVPSADIARLTQLRGDGSDRDVCHLSPGRHINIGRERGDWLFPYDPSMSGTHAQVRSEDADFVIVDCGSRNGVAVAVRGEVQLRKGSRLLVGDKLIRVEMP